MLTPLVDVLAAFPHESVPDGAVLAPHHAYLGLFVVVLALWVVGDNYRDEPVATAVGALALLTGFLLTWRWYPATGAGLSLAGVTVMLAATLWPDGEWAKYRLRWRAVAVVGAVVALDDIAEHAFGVPTPLDWAWVRFLHPVVA